ncbi:MAG TPA: hypothetical protein VG944_00330, partial [Fimbriimonas sp.]|nr:hypothetical protein [Fimbriimonas sp.]
FAQNVADAGLKILSVERSTYRVKGSGLPQEVQRIVFEAALKSKSQIRGFNLAERSLEDAFLDAIGHQAVSIPPPVASLPGGVA